jgi:hypothetical protein
LAGFHFPGNEPLPKNQLTKSGRHGRHRLRVGGAVAVQHDLQQRQRDGHGGPCRQYAFENRSPIEGLDRHGVCTVRLGLGGDERKRVVRDDGQDQVAHLETRRLEGCRRRVSALPSTLRSA